MIDLKSRNIKVDEMSRTSSFFLCPELSARHFDAFQVCKLGAMTQSARHLTATVNTFTEQTIYRERNMITTFAVIPAKAGIFKMSLSWNPAFTGMAVTEHA